MNVSDRGILLGIVFGDGHISPDPRCMTARLQIKHCARQDYYAEYKADLVTRILGGKRPRVKSFLNNGFPGVKFEKTHRYLRVLRNWVYRDRKKVISPYIHMLTPHGLAVWYMDDGCLGIKRRRGKVHAVDLYINCHTSLEEAQLICAAMFKKFGVLFRPNLNNGSYRIRCGTLEARKVAGIIDPFIVDGMRYKIASLTAPTSARALP